VFALKLLAVPFLKIIGALLLVWIGIKLLMPESDDGHQVAASDKLWQAVKTVIVADLVMSVDNVIAIAGAAQGAGEQHQIALVVFGLLISIPIIVWGSQLVIKLMEKFPIVITLGAGLLGFIAGQMLLSDPYIEQLAGKQPQQTTLLAGALGAALVVTVGLWLQKRKRHTA
jgi:YjbE family integral membrane protein